MHEFIVITAWVVLSITICQMPLYHAEGTSWFQTAQWYFQKWANNPKKVLGPLYTCFKILSVLKGMDK